MPRIGSWKVIAAAFAGVTVTVLVVLLLARLSNDEPTNVANDFYEPTVKVLHAKQAIPAGTTAEEAMRAGALELRDTLKAEVQLGAVGAIVSLDEGVALEPIEPGSQITVVQFGCTKEKWDRELCPVQR